MLPDWRVHRAVSILALALVIFASCGKPESSSVELSPPEIASPATLAPGEIVSSALAERSPGGSADATLFETMPAARTGLDFVHRWEPRDEWEREMITTSFAGGGVALGDIDNDELPEVFLTRPHGGSRLYRNLGGFKFEDITASAGIAGPLSDHWSISATFVDIQGDGLLDLYVCGYRAANRLFVNDATSR